jgi:hypothetical protein
MGLESMAAGAFCGVAMLSFFLAAAGRSKAWLVVGVAAVAAAIGMAQLL